MVHGLVPGEVAPEVELLLRIADGLRELRGELGDELVDRRVELGGRDRPVDEPPLDRLGCRDLLAQEAWLEEAKRVAREIAAKGPVATRLAKEAVDRAYESTLQLGLEYERRALYLAFASDDAREGLTAFTEKRKPEFKGK